MKKDYCNPQAYRSEKALDTLRGREDFKKLLAEVDARSGPKAKARD
jgi:hypothetical protein